MFNHGNMVNCMFMPPSRDDEEKELLIDDRIKWTKLTVPKITFKNQVKNKMTKYKMQIKVGNKEKKDTNFSNTAKASRQTIKEVD